MATQRAIMSIGAHAEDPERAGRRFDAISYMACPRQ